MNPDANKAIADIISGQDQKPQYQNGMTFFFQAKPLKPRVLITGANGWIGHNAALALQGRYELIDNNAEYTGTTVYLDATDLQSFLQKVVAATLSKSITGCKCYISTSHSPKTWIMQNNTEQDLGWKPTVNIPETYKPSPEPLLRSRL